MDGRRRPCHARAIVGITLVPASPTASRSHTPLLERDGERGRIEAALARARSGRGTLTIVEGPEGVGLSALLSAARSAAEAEGMLALRARGAELERDFAFGVVRQLFERALAEAPDAERAELLRGPAAVAARLLGLPGSDDRGAAADDAVLDSSFAVLHGLHWLSANLAARRPLLMAIDDAHRADAPSLRFLHFLLARLDDLPIAIVLGAPHVERRAGDELLAGLTADAGADVVRLRPLSADAVARLVEHGLGAAPTPGVRRRLPRGHRRRAVLRAPPRGRAARRRRGADRRPGRPRRGARRPRDGAAGRAPAARPVVRGRAPRPSRRGARACRARRRGGARRARPRRCVLGRRRARRGGFPARGAPARRRPSGHPCRRRTASCPPRSAAAGTCWRRACSPRREPRTNAWPSTCSPPSRRATAGWPTASRRSPQRRARWRAPTRRRCCCAAPSPSRPRPSAAPRCCSSSAAWRRSPASPAGASTCRPRSPPRPTVTRA